MAVKSSPVLPQAPKTGLVTIVNGDSTNQKTVLTAGADATKIVALRAASDDTAARNVQISKSRSAVSYVLGTVNIPIAAGSDGIVPAVDLLQSAQLPGLPKDNDGQPYIFLESGDSLQVKVLVAVTAAKTIWVSAEAANF